MSSALLEAMVEDKQITPDVAQWAEEFPTVELQNEAVHRYRDGRQDMMTRIKADLLKSPEPGPVVPPQVHASVAHPHGHIPQALHSLEKFGAWELLEELEGWMAVKVPPYRWGRRIFSWLCMAFSVEAVLVILLSFAMICGGCWLVGSGVKWAYHKVTSNEQRGKSQQQQAASPAGGTAANQNGRAAATA